jgi:hypothetical protein
MHKNPFIYICILRSINQERLVNERIVTSKISVNRYGRNIFPWNGKQTTTKCLLLWAATCGHLHRQFLTFFLSWSLFFVSIFLIFIWTISFFSLKVRCLHCTLHPLQGTNVIDIWLCVLSGICYITSLSFIFKQDINRCLYHTIFNKRKE